MSTPKPVAIAAQVLILVAVVINVIIRRPEFIDRYYAIGDIFCLITISIVPVLILADINRSIAIVVFGTMASLLADFRYPDCIEFEQNDQLFIGALVVIAIAYAALSKARLKLDSLTAILLLIIITKLWSQNTIGYVGELPVYPKLSILLHRFAERQVFSIGDAVVYMLFSTLIAIVLYREYLFVPGLVFAMTASNLFDELYGEQYYLHDNEWWVVGGASVLLLIGEYLRYRRSHSPLK